MKNLYRYLFLFILLSGSKAYSKDVGPDKQYFQVRSLEDTWLVYHAGIKGHVPFVKERHSEVPSHTLIIDVINLRNYYLLIQTDNEEFLFVEGSLRGRIEPNTWRIMSIDSLYRAYKKPEILLTLFGSKNIESKRVLVGHKKTVQASGNLLISTLQTSKPRSFNNVESYIFISLFLLGFFSVLLTNYKRVFGQFFSPRDLVTFFVREQALAINRPFSPMIFIFVIFLCFVTGAMFVMLQKNDIFLFFSRSYLQDGSTMRVVLGNYLKISILLIGFIILKYLLITGIGNVFNLTKTVYVHFFKIVQASLMFYVTMASISLILTVSYPQVILNWKWLLYTTSVFYFFRTILVYVTLNRSVAVRKLYLISYLCIVEILPIIIGIRYSA